LFHYLQYIFCLSLEHVLFLFTFAAMMH